MEGDRWREGGRDKDTKGNRDGGREGRKERKREMKG